MEPNAVTQLREAAAVVNLSPAQTDAYVDFVASARAAYDQDPRGLRWPDFLIRAWRGELDVRPDHSSASTDPDVVTKSVSRS